MRACPICNGLENSKLVDLNFFLFDDLNLSGAMTLVSCDTCNSLFNQTALTEQDFFNYYQSNEYYADSRSPGSGGLSNDDFTRYSCIYDRVKKYCLTDSPKIIDFGCGKGGLLQWLKENTGAIPIGIEASHVSRNFIQNTLNLIVHKSLDRLEKKADIIILSHVLEHLFSPINLLKQLQSLSFEHTTFYVEVPDAQDYISSTLNWRALYFEHINHFSIQSLSRLVQSAGLSIIEQGTSCFNTDNPKSSKCLYAVLKRIQKEPASTTVQKTYKWPFKETLPATGQIPYILEQQRPVSIWGISQYTQLILGSYPDLSCKIKYLLDNSTAKIGRSINGIKIRSSKELTLLGHNDILLIPDSQYVDEMEEELQTINFPGKWVRF